MNSQTPTPEFVVLPLNSKECDQYLECSQQGEDVFLPREVISGIDSTGDKVVFEKRRREPVPVLRAYFQSLRAISLTATGAPCVGILFLGMNLGWTVDWLRAIAALVGVLLLQIAVNVLNDIGDHRRLIDLPGTWGGSGVLQNGWLTVRDLKRTAWISIGVGGVLGLYALSNQLEVLGGAVILIAAVGTVGYSGQVFQLKYRALGDLTVWLLCGPALTIGFALAAFGAWNQIVVWMGALFGLMACGILHVNNLQDIPVDTARGAKTLASLIGFRWSQHLLAAFYIGALVSACMIGMQLGSPLGWFLLPMMIAGPLVGLIVSKSYQASGPYSPMLKDLRFDTAKAHLATAVLFALGQVGAMFYLKP